MLKSPPSLGKTEHIAGPLCLKPCLELCHQLMSSPAQKIGANISSTGTREGCHAGDPGCPCPVLRWPVGSAGSRSAATLCARDLEVFLPLVQKLCHPILQAPCSVPRRHGGRWKGETAKQHETTQQIYFPAPPASTLPARCSRRCPHVLGVRAGRGHAASPPQPLAATVSHSSVGPWGSAMSVGWEGWLGSQLLGRFASLQGRDMQQVPKPGTSLSWPPVWGGGCCLLFWRDKVRQRGDPGETKQFSRLQLRGSPPLQGRDARAEGPLAATSSPPGQTPCPGAERGAVLPAAASA